MPRLVVWRRNRSPLCAQSPLSTANPTSSSDIEYSYSKRCKLVSPKDSNVGLGNGMVFGACFCTYALGFWLQSLRRDDCITGGTIIEIMVRFYKMPFIVISFHYSSTCLLIIQFIFPCCDLFARLFSSPLSWVQLANTST